MKFCIRAEYLYTKLPVFTLPKASRANRNASISSYSNFANFNPRATDSALCRFKTWTRLTTMIHKCKRLFNQDFSNVWNRRLFVLNCEPWTHVDLSFNMIENSKLLEVVQLLTNNIIVTWVEKVEKQKHPYEQFLLNQRESWTFAIPPRGTSQNS